MSHDFPEDFELENTSLEDLLLERELENWEEESRPEDFFLPAEQVLRF